MIFGTDAARAMMEDQIELKDGAMCLVRAGGSESLAVGGPDWFAWLATAGRFVIVTAAGRITVRKEQAGSGHGRWYWRAYRKHRGVLRRAYLGGDEELTAERLAAAVGELTAERPPAPPGPRAGSEALAGAEILATRLGEPALRRGLVVRPALAARLRAGAGRVTVLTAPAGFGKTTLLAQSFGGEDAVAWLAIEREDDLLRLMRGVGLAIQSARPGAAAGLLAMLHRPGRLELTDLLGQLVRDLLALGRPLTLILDDYHALRDPAAHQLIARLIERMPSTLHLVIAGRNEPPLPLARLRAAGDLVELGAEDLRLNAQEVRELVRQTAGRALGEGDASALALRTEGWAAGLQLAAMALRDQPDPTRFIADFAGTHRFIMDYLIDEVLRQLPGSLRRFLIETSVLDRLDGPLCDAVLRDWAEPGSAQRILEDVERRGLFLSPLDAERRWYRYHQLFSEVLRAELRREAGVERIAALRERAAAWHAAQRRLDQALVEPLTPREREVLELLAAGASNRAIAEALTIALSTAKAHVSHLFGKLGVASRTQAVARGRELGLL